MSEAPMNIYQKLAKIRKAVSVLQKNKEGYGYKYVSEDVILAKVTGMMEKYNISLIPSIRPGTIVVTPYSYTKIKVLRNGDRVEEPANEILVKSEMEFAWINDLDPNEKVVVPWVLIGQQSDASQAFGSGLSYVNRYFLLKYFNAATTEDDPDNWRAAQREAANAEQIEVAKAIIGQVHEMVSAYVTAHEDKRDAVTAIVKKYAKEKGRPSGNYFAIKDPDVARSLLEEVTKVCKEE